jgi:hypothetical protein
MATYLSENARRYEIDATPRKADCQYVAHAQISTVDSDGAREIVCSGDLAAFVERTQAVSYAESWARRWLDNLRSL